jgi:hypothetical protein
VTKYIAEQWDIDRLNLLEERLREYNDRKSPELSLIAFDLRVEIQKLQRQAKK